jgi:Cu/Ag efflux pump CusA
VNVNSAEIWIALADESEYDKTTAAIERVLRGYPGLRSSLVAYPQDRVQAVETGTSDPVDVRLFGSDLDVLRQKAEEVRQRISTVPGVVQPKVQTLAEEPTLEVRVNLEKAQQYGINPGDVRRTAATYFSGLLVGNLYQEQKVFDVVVRGAPSTQQGPASLENLLIDTPGGDAVRLGDVAQVRVVQFPTVIRHDATLRSLNVTAGVSGRDLGSVLRDVKEQVRTVPMPLEYHSEVLSGLAEQQNEGLQTAGLAIGAAVGIFLLLQAALASWRLAAMAFLTLPLAGAGGVLAAFFVGGIMTLGALIGLFAVLGIAVRNSVVLLSAYQGMQPGEDATPDIDSVMSATRERAGAILLTAGATIAALIPLVVLGPIAGAEILQPLAVVVIGGLVSSTLLSVFVIPTLYLRLATTVRGQPSDVEPMLPPGPATVPAP